MSLIFIFFFTHRMNKGIKTGSMAFARNRPLKYEAGTNLFWIVWEVMLSGLMVGCIAIWFFYATVLVQDSAFQTRYE